MTRRLYRTQPMNRVKLTRIAYNKLRFMFDGQVGVIDFDKHDFEETGLHLWAGRRTGEQGAGSGRRSHGSAGFRAR